MTDVGEGRLGKIVVQGNRHIDDASVRARAATDVPPASGVPGARAATTPSAGLPPKLDVAVIAGTVRVSNAGVSQNIAAGQFGDTPCITQPPVAVPAGPGSRPRRQRASFRRPRQRARRRPSPATCAEPAPARRRIVLTSRRTALPDPSPHPPTGSPIDRLLAGALDGSTRLDLRGHGLRELPAAVLRLADTLEVLDVSHNALTDLPDGLARCTRLHTVFASHNALAHLPPVLGRLPALDTLGVKANRIAEVPADALAPTLRWLILTDNRIPALPATLTDCRRLQKLMLAGNRLRDLPRGVDRLDRLELLRLSANAFERIDDALPADLLALPRLVWLAHAGNPFSAAREQRAARRAGVAAVRWDDLDLEGVLGEGASGTIHAARWQPPDAPAREVAVKFFKGAVTSDGLPACEIAATLAAGDHPHLVGVLGALTGHPDGTAGLVLPRLGPHWAPLAGPPSAATCSRDVYADGLRLSAADAASIARAATAALDHLHARGLAHGDLYAHNLLVDGRGSALLGDFGAASFLPDDADPARADALRALDRRALRILLDELAARSDGEVPRG